VIAIVLAVLVPHPYIEVAVTDNVPEVAAAVKFNVTEFVDPLIVTPVDGVYVHV
jgi:hypothetical protein